MDRSNEVKLTINGIEVTIKAEMKTRAKDAWLRNATYGKLWQAIQGTEYQPLVQYNNPNGDVYKYVVLISTVTAHNLPFRLPAPTEDGAALLQGLIDLLELELMEVEAILKVVDPLLTTPVDKKTAPGSKLSDEEKKDSQQNVKSSGSKS